MYFCQILGIEGSKFPLSTDLLITPLYGLTVGHFLKFSQGIAEPTQAELLSPCQNLLNNMARVRGQAL